MCRAVLGTVHTVKESVPRSYAEQRRADFGAWLRIGCPSVPEETEQQLQTQ